MSGALTPTACKILDTIFLDVDEYCPDELMDEPPGEFDIDEKELRKRLTVNVKKLQALS